MFDLIIIQNVYHARDGGLALLAEEKGGGWFNQTGRVQSTEQFRQ